MAQKSTVIFLGKRTKPGSPKRDYPGAHLWGTTHSNQRYTQLGPIDDWDEWHDWHPIDPTPFYPGILARRPKTYAWYRTLPVNDRPLVMLEHDDRIPASVGAPWRELAKIYGIPNEAGHLWATCQVDWMMMEAEQRGYKRIILHGHGCRDQVEHFVAHRGILYWVGYMRGRGIEVVVLEPSWFRAPSKPYATEAGGWQARR